MAKEPESDASERLTDGSTVAIDGVVDWAGEGDHRKVGERIGPGASAEPDEDDTAARRARLREAAAALPEPDEDDDDVPLDDEPDEGDDDG